MNTLASSFLIGCSSFLPITRTSIKSRMSSKFDQIRSWTAEFAAHELLEKIFYLLENYSKYFYDMLALR